MSQSAKNDDALQELLAQGLLSDQEVLEARRLIDEAARDGRTIAMSEVLLRVGAAAAKAHHEAEVAAEGAAAQPPAPEETAAAPDIQASGLRLLHRIGRGGQAVVYKCHDASTDRYVAVKVLLASAAEDAEARERFLREARAAAKLTHPNIVTIHAIGTLRNTFYIVMEYVDGGSLADLLAVHKRLAPAEAVAIVRQVAEALRYAHGRGFIHRDIKPKNVLLTSDGVAKLADMGLARHVSQADEKSGKAYGTPYYISPELVTGDPPPDFRTDLYSLGATFYEMVAGRPPFVAPTPQEIMRKHVFEPLPDPRQFVPDLPQGLCWLLAKAMAKEPEDRYASAADFLAALDELHLSEPAATPATSVTTIEQVGAPLGADRRRSRRAEIAGPGFRTTVRAGPHVQGPATPRRRGGNRAILVAAAAVGLAAAAGAGLLLYSLSNHGEAHGPMPDSVSAGGSGPLAPSAPVAASHMPPPVPASDPAALKAAEEAKATEAVAQSVLAEARQFEANPDAWIGDVLAAYEEVAARYPKTKAAEEARRCIERLKTAPPKQPGLSQTPAHDEPTISPSAPGSATTAAGGDLLLRARDAAVHGNGARYEFSDKADDPRDNIGFWNRTDTWVGWEVTIDEPGTYAVEVTYALAGRDGGGEYEVRVGDHRLAARPRDTGRWGNFVKDDLGTVSIGRPGRLTVEVRPVRIERHGLMNLQAVGLKRIR